MVNVLKAEEKQSFSVSLEIKNQDGEAEQRDFEFRFPPGKLEFAEVSADGCTWINVAELRAAIGSFDENYMIELGLKQEN